VEGAAQIALSMLVFTVALITLERAQAQRKGRGAEAAGQAPSRQPLMGVRGAVAFLACLAPVLLGFAVPALHLVVNAAIRVIEFGLPRDLPLWIWSSTWLAAMATGVTVAAGFAVAFVHRHSGGAVSALLGRIAALGYALPGTVLAVGLLGPMGWLDEGLFWALGAAAPAVSGSAAALVLAYAVRFMAMPVNTLEAAYARMPAAMDDAARGLGARHRAVAWRVHLPLLAPATAASAILVLIESMKELPATLLLRPLNVETLATAVYAEASRGTYEDGAVAALAIVVVSLLPVMVLVRGLRPAPMVPLRDTAVEARV
jgi:iron(III) transport system permease protein